MSSANSTGSSSKVDCARASQSVWLVKVPNYLAEVWNKSDSTTGIVGTLEIPLNAAPNNVSFHLAENLIKHGSIQNIDIPPEHKLVMSDVHQTMGVFSETLLDDDDPSSEGRSQIALEGKIVKRADCRPIETPGYMMLKKKSIEKACRPERQAKQLKEIVKSFKPVNDHVSDMEPEKKRKEDRKRVRGERDEVLDIIFSAFEKHQYYSLKDLVGITQQPVVHLKVILRDVCNYNLKNPHKNTYELKPEYRHYKTDSKEEET